MSQEVDTISMPDGEEGYDFLYSPQHSQDDFLREVLIKLAENEKTPTDIFSSTFTDVKQDDNEYLLVRTQVDIHITASIGHDRVEEYWDKETYREDGIQKVRDVKKTRTVTDWTPFSCEHKGTCVSIVSNVESDSNDYVTDRKMIDVIRNTPRECGEAVASKIIPNDGAVRRAQTLCGHKCMRKSLPGDKQKDERYSGDIAVDSISGIVMPDYGVSYTYNGKEYNASAHSCGALDIDCKYPSDMENVTRLGKKKAMPFLIASPCALVLAIVLSFFDLSVVGIPLFLCAIVLLVLFFVMKSKFVRKITEGRQKIKLDALKETLKKRGLKPLD